MTRRKRKRLKIQNTAMLILETQGDHGISIKTLVSMLDDALPSRITSSILGQIMKPFFDRGEITRETISDHGIEVKIWKRSTNVNTPDLETV